ncbi:DUF892 family protein [Bradyrhizobium sp. ARR65]|uniref:YciE/YciF ferroxidase family protein n=1 Tax=Bradyrhizobium sp. ARR65 TaxID=1040989 RepID=UPI0004631E0B|nr:DUF892 family protein [Bradyrhizobium sp. ARR65]
MQIDNFKDMYIAELQELVSVEEQLENALLRMAEASSHASLRAALEQHQRETIVQGERLRSILKKHGASPKLHTDQAMQALINETKKMYTIVTQDYVRDAGIIASAQRLEHYEIAAYGTAAALAGQLEFREDQHLLHNSLEQEKRTDELLTTLAKTEVNRDANA